MKTFLRIVERTLVHLYALAALGLALAFLIDVVAYNHAVFTILQVQAEALLEIVQALRGHAI